MSEMLTVAAEVEPRIVLAMRWQGLELALMLEAPSTAALFRDYVDLAIVSDYVGFSAFSRLVDCSSPSTAGFLTPGALETVRARFGHRARSPVDLIHLPPGERIRPRNIDRYCTLLHIGTLDRDYAGKFILFVPSLVHDSTQVPDRFAEDYAEAALYVAAYRRSRAIYFAGFGGTDGSFADDVIVKLTERILAVREIMPLPPVRVFFKYFPYADDARIAGLVSRLARLSAATEQAEPPEGAALEEQRRVDGL